jgi:hypothetical protein
LIFFLSSDHFLYSFGQFIYFNWIQHPGVCLTSWMPPPLELYSFRDVFLLFILLLVLLFSFFQLFILLLFLGLDRWVVFLSYNSRVCSYEFAS